MINSARKTARGLLLDNGKILLVRRTSSRARDLTGKTEWLSVPGGGVEKSERPNQTVLREMKEELGLDVKVGNLLLTQYVPQDESLDYYFVCEPLAGSPELQLDAVESSRIRSGTDNYAVEWHNPLSCTTRDQLYWAYKAAYEHILLKSMLSNSRPKIETMYQDDGTVVSASLGDK